MRKLTMAIALALTLATTATAPPVDWLEAIAAHYKDLKSLSARYKRITRLMPPAANGMGELVASGKLVWARELKLRMHQLRPTRELVVSNGRVVWWVRPAKAEVQVYALGHFTEGLKSLVGALGALEKLKKDYIVEELKVSSSHIKLVLKPKHPRLEMARLTCWFARKDMMIERIRITTMLGENTTYQLRDVRLNPPLSPESFSYTPPPNYRVIDNRPVAPGPRM